ncbi:hypothetical protein [uncultured Kordia sp.]|uniref:hypothetical protein n=1 Tax=uncultured Kordia sp. TaxID=507699 RepID=UPI002627BAF5|nr:hypothetical protein [uncultured Kordia sp.]
MKNLTILKMYFIIYLVSCFIYFLADWQIIVNENISRIVFIIQLILIGFGGLFLDWMLQKMIKNKKVFHGLELLLIVVFTIIVWNEL